MTQKLKIKRKKKERKKRRRRSLRAPWALASHVTFAPPNPFFFQFTSWLCLHVPPFLPCPPFFYKHPCQEPHNLEHILQTQLTYPSFTNTQNLRSWSIYYKPNPHILPSLSALLQTPKSRIWGIYYKRPTHMAKKKRKARNFD